MILLQLFWLVLPAGIANLIPPFAAIVLPNFSRPLDFGLHLNGRRLFGDHKTVRGLICGTLAGFAVFIIQKQLYQLASIRWLYVYNYQSLPLHFGLSLSLFALVGDIAKSLIKRQLDIPSGHSWFPWDQIDWAITSIVVIVVYFHPPIFHLFLILVMTLILHLVTKYIGFFLKINPTKI